MVVSESILNQISLIISQGQICPEPCAHHARTKFRIRWKEVGRKNLSLEQILRNTGGKRERERERERERGREREREREEMKRHREKEGWSYGKRRKKKLRGMNRHL